MRYFNKEGPIVRSRHYCIDPLSRLDVVELLGMVADQRYFVLHAPRQTGKTTVLGALRDVLNESGEYRCVYVNVEPGAAAREDVAAAMRTIISRLGSEARRRFGDHTVDDAQREILETHGPYGALQETLTVWAGSDPKPLVLLIDEIDGQHTKETGQRFADEAVAEIVRMTRGQPWLVNALAHEACFAKEGVRDRTREVAPDDVGEAAERLILRRDTHLDQLAEKLKEPRVRRVIEPLLTGTAPGWRFDPEDLRYARDLGLVSSRRLAVANPIYREVIPRSLSAAAQDDLDHEPELVGDPTWYVGSDGRLQVDELMAAFQSFFREHSEHWLDRFQYREAGPQLLLQAFLQRIVNSGGRIEREYGAGKRRMDLGIVWPGRRISGPDGRVKREEQRAVIECKLARSGLERAIRLGIEQTAAYMDVWGADEGHLAVFDRREGVSWEKKVFRRDEESSGHRVTVWGM